MSSLNNRRPVVVTGGVPGNSSILNGRGSRIYTQLPNGTAPETTRGVRFEADDETSHHAASLESLLYWTADTVYALVAFQCSLGVITIVILLYVIVRPFSLGVYRRLANQLGMGSYLEAIALLLPNTKICLTGDSDVPSPVGTSILVSNHVVDADWFHFLMLGRCVGLRGSIKVFLRNELLQLNKTINPARASQRCVIRRNSPPSPTRANGSSSNVLSTTIMQENYGNGNVGRSGVSLNHSPSNGFLNGNAGSATAIGGAAVRDHHPASPDLVLTAKFLHSFLEFPLIDEADYVSDRESLFQLLRSFAGSSPGTTAPVHFLLFPEGWSLYNGEDRKSVLARSNEFAKREGRPQLKHLLLPRTTGFNASISSLRESSPVIYDVTIAYRGYDGSVPQKTDLSTFDLWGILRRLSPDEIHIRLKRYSMEEVLQDASWLDKKWAEKDRMLDHFSRHQSFPVDSRGFCRHQVFETRFQSIETSIISLCRLILLPCAVPVLLFLSIPIVWTTFMAWLVYKGYQYVFPDPNAQEPSSAAADGVGTSQTPGSASQAGTPFIPATPFASPSISNWRDMLLNNSGN
ncbi:acyltransferase family-domain containing protein [Nitzschia inconspicua]|uniref:Acyltransferase family-domain containing protein n=1 Tax=Nitzschia inconspicua TaxID=303405 RepID=A0A9K3PG47_9STRA|nr:acyltransferase family-domain containing protein [Nitzschia inconspicua]